MSDTALDKIIHIGTAAARAAFTPSPGTSGQLFIWVDNDSLPSSDPATWIWDSGSAAFVQINTAGAGSVTTGVTLTNNQLVVGAGASAIKVSDLTGDVTTAGGVATTIANSAVTLAKIANAAANSKVLGSGSAGSGSPYSELTVGDGLSISGTTITGKVAQIVSTLSSAVNTGSTRIPLDDTIPQNTEGDEYMTLAITPKSATSTLLIQVTVCGASSSASSNCFALFQDTTADALAASFMNHLQTANGFTVGTMTFTMTSGTTSSTTFKIRAATNSGTFTFNGFSGGRIFGAIPKSSMVITEYLP